MTTQLQRVKTGWSFFVFRIPSIGLRAKIGLHLLFQVDHLGHVYLKTQAKKSWMPLIQSPIACQLGEVLAQAAPVQV